MTDIWKGAPVDATHYGYTDNGDHLQFYRIPGILGEYDYMPKGRQFWSCANGTPIAPRLIARPAPWNGEGLPPIGMACEFRHTGWSAGYWVAVVPLYVSDAHLIVAHRNEEMHYHTQNIELRPTKTPEQIAADTRAKVVQRMVEIYCGNPGSAEECMGLLYDAGLLGVTQ